MAFLYCAGVPLLSMWFLHIKREKIIELQTLEQKLDNVTQTNEYDLLSNRIEVLKDHDPLLNGLSPL